MKQNAEFLRLPLLLLAHIVVCPAGAFAEIVSEPFDYQPERIEIRKGASRINESFHGGTGWDPEPRSGWKFGIWGNLGKMGGEVSFDPLDPGSLKAAGRLAAKYSSTGGSFANKEQELVLTATRGLDAENGPLSHAALPATTVEGNAGRSKPGIGAGGKVVWLSALIEPGRDRFGAWIKLNNTGYGSQVVAHGGLVFQIDGTQSNLTVEQDWPVLNRIRKNTPGRGTESIKIRDGEPVLLIAKIEFGANWGGDTEFATKDVHTFDPESAPTDGTITVWIDPDLSSEPKRSAADLIVPVFEFRFGAMSLRLGPGAAIDEIRMAPTFQELLTAP
jgi:hypothetical protein